MKIHSFLVFLFRIESNPHDGVSVQNISQKAKNTYCCSKFPLHKNFKWSLEQNFSKQTYNKISSRSQKCLVQSPNQQFYLLNWILVPTVNINVKLTKILSKQGKLWISWTKVSKICLVLLWLLLLLFNLLFLVISHFTLSQCYVVLHFMVIFLIHEFFWGNVSHDSYLMHEEWMIKLCKKNPLNRTTPCIDFKEAKKSPPKNAKNA